MFKKYDAFAIVYLVYKKMRYFLEKRRRHLFVMDILKNIYQHRNQWKFSSLLSPVAWIRELLCRHMGWEPGFWKSFPMQKSTTLVSPTSNGTRGSVERKILLGTFCFKRHLRLTACWNTENWSNKYFPIRLR